MVHMWMQYVKKMVLTSGLEWKHSAYPSRLISFTHPQIQFIHLHIHEQHKIPWNLSVVYGSLDHSLRKFLWQKLSRDNLSCLDPWLVVGDFNSVMTSDEVSTRGAFDQRSAGFFDWIFEQKIIDLGYSRPRFTWSRGDTASNFTAACLERVLSTPEWRSLFDKAAVYHLPKMNSDHTPLMIQLSGEDFRLHRPRFLFQAAWLMHPQFNEIVKAT